MKRKMVSFLLVLLLLAGLVPQGVFAAETEMLPTTAEEKHQSKIRTTRLDLRNMESTSNAAEGWSWDSENSILTLDSVNFVVGDSVYAIRMNSGTIVLRGENTVTCTYDDGREDKGISVSVVGAIYASNKNLIFEGPGSLNVSSTAYGGKGIYTWRGNVTVNGGTITATGGTSIRRNGSSCGIECGSLTVNGGSFTAVGRNSNGQSVGIDTYPGGLIVNGGTVRASSGAAQNEAGFNMPSSAIIARSIDIGNGSITEPSGAYITSYKDDNATMQIIASASGETATNVVINGSKPVETPSTTPKITSLYPANGATNVGCTAANPPIFQVTFDREIAARGDEEYQANVNLTASQPFAIYRAEDDALVYKPTQYSESDFLIAYTNEKSTLSVSPINRHILLDPGTKYYISMGAGFVTFADGTKSPAITKGQWSFTTEGEKEDEEELNFSIARSSISLLPGQTANPRVTLTPSDAKVSWTSSRSSVARVSSDGTITGVAPGTATITGTATLGNQKKTVTCAVTVNQNLLFGWTKTTANLKVGDLESLSFTYQPADARISITSSNPSAIKVEGSQYSKGSGYTTIRAVGGGTATITAKVTADNQEKVGTILLTVGNDQIPEDLFLKQNDNKKCTLISSAMMLRNKARLNGDSGWRNITEAALTKIAWGPNGMIWDVTIRGIKETTQGLASNGYNTLEKKKNYFISLLESHPEGIVIYDHGKPHAVFLTDYDGSTDTFYCADPAPGASNGRIPLIDSILPGDNQDEIINSIDQIAYVSHSTKLKTLSSTQFSTHCPVDMVIRVHGQTLDSRLINGTQSTEYATMTTVGTGDEKQVTVTVNGDAIADEDLEVEIIGAGTGEMTFTVKHNFTDNTSESYIFADIPVSASTVCKVNDITPQSTILLTIKNGNTNEETYIAKNAEILTFPFVDVKSTDWFYPAVQYVYENSIMNGTSATTFAPNGTVERSQVVQMLYNLEGQPTVTGSTVFTDVDTDEWYGKAVLWAERTGVVDGYEDNTFRPGKAVSREEFAQMLYNYAVYKGYDLSAAANLSKFPDGKNVSTWAEKAMRWANGNELINGHDDGRLDPGGTAIRAQAASILMRFDQNLVK